MSRNFTLLLILMSFAITVVGQESKVGGGDSLNSRVEELQKGMASLKKLKVSGWIQMQYQSAQTKGVANYDGGNFAPNSDNRSVNSLAKKIILSVSKL